MRSAFYYGLDCAYLQKELSNIKEEDQSLKAFLDEAIAAEGRALHYKDTLNRGHALDSSTPSEVTAAKWNDPKPTYNKNNGNRRNNRRDGRKHNGAPHSAPNSGCAPASNHKVKGQPYHQQHQHQRKQQQQHAPQLGNTTPTGARPKQRCYYCNKPGHKDYECRKKKDDQQNSASSATNGSPSVFPPFVSSAPVRRSAKSISTTTAPVYFVNTVHIPVSARTPVPKALDTLGSCNDHSLAVANDLRLLHNFSGASQLASIGPIIDEVLQLANSLADWQQKNAISSLQTSNVSSDMNFTYSKAEFDQQFSNASSA